MKNPKLADDTAASDFVNNSATRKAWPGPKKGFKRLSRDRSGNFAIMGALGATVVALSVGVLIDFGIARSDRQLLQQAIDSGVLAATYLTNESDQKTLVKSYLVANTKYPVIDANLTVTKNSDGSLTATYRRLVPTSFLGITGVNTIPVSVKATAIRPAGGSNACIYVLGSSGQDTLINSGANLTSAKCELHAQSTADPAFIMNSNAKVDLAKFCVKGNRYIKNGGTLSNLSTGCAAETDPFAGKLAEPTVPSTCVSSGALSGQSFSLKPGVHCNTTFNGNPTVTFEPGLHIIKGRMILNSGSTVKASGVTFYFPDTNSEIRANGSLTFTGTAPTSGSYHGVLMFERTSNPNNNSNKTQYIFNGSNGEVLEGLIYLPNRNVTYNSTTNVTARITLVVNQIIMNAANWKIEPYQSSSSTAGGAPRLTE